MSFYRAALAAAYTGNLSGAARLAQCSLLLKEGAPSAGCLLELLNQHGMIDMETLSRLRTLTDARRYKKALKVKLPKTSKAHTIRGLLYAQIGRYRNAREEFALALTLDRGNDLARQAQLHCFENKRGFLS
jgi:tetratricopeptide (TPR) repeat protein